MAVNWSNTTLGECAAWLSGGTPFKGNDAFWSGSIPWVSAKDMKSFRLHDTEDHISPLAVGHGGKVVPAGTILLLVRGMTLHNDVPICMVTREMAFNQDIKALRPAKNIDGAFLAYWLLAHKPDLLASVDHAGHGTGRLVTDTLKEKPVNLPPLAEQKAIAAVLGALDDKIELNRRMNTTLEAMARALFQSWFIDFDPVRWNMDQNQHSPHPSPTGRGRSAAEGEGATGLDFDPVRAKLDPATAGPTLDLATADLFPDSFQDSEAGHIPKGWEVKTADEVSTVGIGKTPPRMEQHWFSENPADVPWMSIRDLGIAGVFISHTSEFLTTEAVEKFRVKRIPDNTVVLSFKLTMGRVAITDGEMLSNEAIAHFRLKPDTTFGSAYLYCYLKGFGYDQLGSTSSIATAINSDMVRGMRVLVPPKGIAEAFERTVKPMFRQMKKIQKQSHTLATLRDTLLPKLLTGELVPSSS